MTFLIPHDISYIQPKLSHHPNMTLISTTSRVNMEAHLQWKFYILCPMCQKRRSPALGVCICICSSSSLLWFFALVAFVNIFISPSIPSLFPPCRPWHHLLAPCSCWAHSFPACNCALTALSLSQQSPKHPAHFKKKCVCWWPIKTSRWPGLGSLCQNGRAQVREIYIFLLYPWRRSVFVAHAEILSLLYPDSFLAQRGYCGAVDGAWISYPECETKFFFILSL